jgi:hypothetical protein
VTNKQPANGTTPSESILGQVPPATDPSEGTTRQKQSVRDVELLTLLDGLEPVYEPTEPDVDRWLREQGVEPGTKRVLSREMYRAYREWWLQTPDTAEELLIPSMFGRQLKQKFHCKLTNKGAAYYVRRVAGKPWPDYLITSPAPPQKIAK